MNQALELFNQKGVREVSTRMISEASGISQGNLTYHYTKKEDIIYALYLMLVDEMNAIFEKSGAMKKISVHDIFQGTFVTYSTLSKYRFCMIDFVQLMREFPRINEHFKQLMAFRKQQFIGLFEICIQSGVMLPEEFPGQYNALSVQMSVFGDNWLSHSEILFEGNAEESCLFYTKQALILLHPFFTPPSKKEAQAILNQR